MIGRSVVLVMAVFLMIAVTALGVAGVAGGPNPTVVAAIGFVLLAAFTVGELTKALAMPSVTGYIATGLILGPGVTRFFSQSLVADMTIFNSMALSLIALSAGLELHASSVRRIARTMGATVALKLPLLAVLVPAVVMGAWYTTGLAGVESVRHAWLLAAVLAMLSIATSSAVPIAVIAEHRAKGRYTDLAMMMPVVKDVVVVLGLAALIPLAQSATTGGQIDLELLRHLLLEILLTIVVGAAVGVCLILYVRWVHREMLVFTVAMVLGVSELSRLLHLELILLFITAGIVVRNFSHHEAALLGPIRTIALPVYVVFFTTAGANIDVPGTQAVFGIAVALTAARALAYWIAGRVGARAGGETRAVQAWGWLGYIPQSAVNIGLTLLAARGIPALEKPILSLGFATIALHLVVGPILLGIALRKSGESALAPARVPGDEEEPSPPGDAPRRPIEDPDVAALGERLHARIAAFVREEHAHIAAERGLAEALALTDEAPGAAIDAARADARRALQDDWTARVDALHRALVEQVQSAPAHVDRLPDPQRLLPVGGERPLRRLRRAWARLRARSRVSRRVPLRSIARVALEPALAAALLEVQRDRLRFRAAALHAVERALASAGDAALDRPAIRAELDAMATVAEETIASTLDRALAQGLARLDRTVGAVASRLASARAVRYSRAEPMVTAAIGRRRAEAPKWVALVGATLDSAVGALHLRSTRRAVHDAIERLTLAPLRQLEQDLDGVLAGISRRLAEASARLAATEDGVAEVGGIVASAFSPEVQLELRRERAQFRRALQLPAVRTALLQAAAHVPEQLELVAADTPVEQADTPEAVSVLRVNVRARLESAAVEELMRVTSEALVPVQRALSALPLRLEQAVAVAGYTLGLAAQERFPDEASRFDAVAGSLERARGEAAEVGAELRLTLVTARQTIEAAKAAAFHDDVLDLRSAPRGPRGLLGSLVDAALPVGRRLWGALAGGASSAWRRFEGASHATMVAPVVRDRRIRSGVERLDAAGIRAFLDERLPAPQSRPLPAVLQRAFSGEPLTDRREAVAFKDEVGEVVQELGDPDSSSPHSVLVVGRRGSGRTTLVNMALLRLPAGRLLRLDDPVGLRSSLAQEGLYADPAGGSLRRVDGRERMSGRGLVAALAQELGCPEDARAVVEALRAAPGADPGRAQALIVIDGLEQWALPTPEGVAVLEELALLVPLAGAEARWLVTASGAALRTLEEVVGVRRLFRRVVDLPALDADELRRVIEARERLTGHRFDYTATLPAGLPFGAAGADRHFAHLVAQSRGVLRAALALHVAALQPVVAGDRVFAVDLRTEPGLPFVGALDAETRAALGLLVRFGALDAGALAVALGVPPDRALGILHELTVAGLLEAASGRAARLHPHLEPFLESELAAQSLIPDASHPRPGRTRGDA